MGIGAIIVIVIVAILVAMGVNILPEYERGVLFRLGRFVTVRGAGFQIIIPGVDRLVRISLREIVMDVPAQEVITRDNVTVRVNAVLYFRVLHPDKAVIQVENYLSYRDAKTLSMVASGQVSEYCETNVISTERISILKSAAIYGANASGKSNLLAAMTDMRWFIINSSKEGQADEPIEVSPFKLDTVTENEPSRFEATFIMNEIRYRYGYQANSKSVVAEWLFETKKDAEKALFLRENDGIDVRAGFSEGKGLESKTRNNSLFISVAANFNGELAGNIIKWFRQLTVAHGLHEHNYEDISTQRIQNDSQKKSLVELICKADLGIENISTSEEVLFPPEQKPKEGFLKDIFETFMDEKKTIIRTSHTKYSNGTPIGTVFMKLDKEESEGTRKFFKLAGPILESLENGSVLVIDELEAKLHPLLTRMIVRLYHSEATNPNGAQLIFATHDTNLLNYVKFRRDQIWFTEKDHQQATDLYSLAEIKVPREDGTDRKVRKDARYEKDYFKGKYGAIPYLGDFEQLLERKDVANG